MRVELDWAAPLLVFPDEFDTAEASDDGSRGGVVVADLGRLQVSTMNDTTEGSEGNDATKVASKSQKTAEECDDDDFYDCDSGSEAPEASVSEPRVEAPITHQPGEVVGERWRCLMSDMSVLTGASASTILADGSIGELEDKIKTTDDLEPFVEHFSVVVMVKSVQTESRGQRIEVDATLPRLRVALNSTSYRRLLRLRSALAGSSNRGSDIEVQSSPGEKEEGHASFEGEPAQQSAAQTSERQELSFEYQM